MHTCCPQTLIRLAGRIWLVVACLTAASGCQVALSGASCSGDSDCGDEQVCADGICAETCSTDEDCPDSDTTCQPYYGDDGRETLNVCRSDSSTDPTGPDAGRQCSTDRQCRRRLDNERAECGLGQRCILPPPKRYSVVLRDQSDNDRSDDGAAGADIAAAFVTGPSGRVDEAYGWARALVYRPAGGADGTSHLDGTPVSLDDSGRCVDGSFDETTTSLGGQGGLMLMNFVDDAGNAVEINGDTRIIVIEWGENCGVDAAPRDEFEAYLCISESERIEPDRDCTHRLGTGSGYSTFTPDLDGSSVPD